MITLVCVLLLIGCNPNKIVGKDGEYLITHDGKKICDVAYTQVIFEKKHGYFIFGNFGPPRNLSEEYFHNGRSNFSPEGLIEFCRDQIKQDVAVCDEVEAKVRLPCSWCARITKDFEVIDENRSCLDNTTISWIENQKH